MEATSLVRTHLKEESFDLAELDVFFELLTHLPLAIMQAITCINENVMPLEEYLHLLRSAEADVQDFLEQEIGDMRKDKESISSVFKTWRLSFDLIRKKNQRAVRVLLLIALLRNAHSQNACLPTSLRDLGKLHYGCTLPQESKVRLAFRTQPCA